MIKRDHALQVIARHVTDEIVVAVYQAAFDWMVIAPRDLNYFSVGAMGQASSHGLGLALGRPDKRVIVFDGDGSLLMNLGSLVTIGNVAPTNFVHLVFRNDCYEANGSHPLPGAGRIDFAGFARAAGYRAIWTIESLDDLALRAGDILNAKGPAFAELHIVPGAPSPQDYSIIHGAATRERFRQALDASRPVG